MGMRLVSLALLIAAWYVGSQLAGARLLPDPQAVALAIVDEARSGALAFNLGATLARVAVAFVIAMALGSVIGLIMGRSRIADRLGDPWLIVLLNLPALARSAGRSSSARHASFLLEPSTSQPPRSEHGHAAHLARALDRGLVRRLAIGRGTPAS